MVQNQDKDNKCDSHRNNEVEDQLYNVWSIVARLTPCQMRYDLHSKVTRALHSASLCLVKA